MKRVACWIGLTLLFTAGLVAGAQVPQVQPGYTNICAILYDEDKRLLTIYHTERWCPDVSPEGVLDTTTTMTQTQYLIRVDCPRWGVFRAVTRPRVPMGCKRP